MLRRVNGLFGWIEANERRSLLLFAGFVAAFNVAAALALYLPLATFDAGHAPVFAWAGYAMRYVPLVTLAGIGVFAAQLAWHMGSVQRIVGFAYVEGADEPRLCGIVEPLAIQIGLPPPYVGVIENRALNAFACGTGRSNAVVVVTRGLVEGLDDDELAAVVAHELAHIARGDVRLLAAADACLRMIGWLVRPRLKKTNALQELAAFPMIMAIMPPLYLFVLAVGCLAQASLSGAHLVRMLIASSREFVADAAAIESTHNPAALVSALRRIDGHHRLPDLAPGCDAMMIAGATEGAFATHPTMADRIEAIVALTGSMALIAPARRDTRPERLRTSAVLRTVRVAPTGVQTGAFRRLGAIDDRNMFGLTRRMTTGAVLALAVFVGLHQEVLRQPAAVVALLDPRPANGLMAVAARGSLCNVAALAKLLAGRAMPDQCKGGALDDFTAEQAKVGGPVGRMLAGMVEPGPGMHRLPGGGFSNVAGPDVEAEEVRSNRCYRTKGYRPGDRGLHGINAPPDRSGTFDIRRWLANAERLATVALSEERPQARDQSLRSYVTTRRTITETIHHFFGEPGLDHALASFASPVHAKAVALLSERLRDPGFSTGLTDVQRAEMTLLATKPDSFLPCVARRTRPPAESSG
jgi:Zn-dependent protease with chaperone function